jgi:transcriptional regulator GlxA family with amidase domain
MINVTILFLEGGNFSTAAIPIEVFRGTGVLWNRFNDREPVPRFSVTTASLGGRPACADSVLSVVPSEAIERVKKPDLIFVPAAGLDIDTLVRTAYDVEAAIARNARVVPYLKKWAAQGVEIAAVCTGVSLIAAAGLLDGKRATTHWGLANLYRKHFPRVDWQPEKLITEDRGVTCGGGVNAACDLSLYLVEKYCGRELAAQCARALVIEMPRSWQIPFGGDQVLRKHDDDAILGAQDWVHENYARGFQFDGLAKRVGMSPRNFARRFKAATGQSPLAYLHGVRIGAAKRLLQNGRQSVQEVCAAVGYDDAIFFRTLFRRHCGIGPNEYRQRFGPRRLDAAAE